jgi:hypothetical protein
MTAAQPTPPAPPVDDKDWTWVLERACPACGFEANLLAPAAIGAAACADVARIVRRLADPDAASRPAPQVWSPLEYACHVRDVCRVFGGRLQLLLDEDDPVFPNWDQDRTALAEQYWTQDPAVVAAECTEAADVIAAAFDAVRPDQWVRRGRRSNGSVFTVQTLGRYFAHDLAHHVHDIGA